MKDSYIIANVKLKIQNKIEIPSDKQWLSFAGRRLENERTLRYYNIPTKSVLHLGYDGMQIKVHSFKGCTISLKVKASDTIGSLKSNIQGMEGVSYDQQNFFYAGIQLDYRQRIFDLDIPVNTPHHLVLRRRGPMKISVKVTTNGIEDTYEVEAYKRLFYFNTFCRGVFHLQIFWYKTVNRHPLCLRKCCCRTFF